MTTIPNTTPKYALVTGGNRGIGFAIAQGLIARGYEVIMTARSGDRAAQGVLTLGATAHPLVLDVSDDASIAQAFQTVSQRWDRLDLLVNNAGIYPDGEESINALTVPRAYLQEAMNTNTFGAIRMVQVFLPLLVQSGDPRVINVASSMGAPDGLTTSAPSYCLSKLALIGATKMLAQSLADTSVVINAMCPGWVRTDMGGPTAPRSPEEGADTAIWLATEAPRGERGKFWRDRTVIPF